MAKRRCAESYEAAGTRESCWLVGVDTVKVSFSSKVAGGMSSQKGAPLNNTSVSFSRTLLPFPVVSFPFLCVFGFAFGSSRKARTSVVLRLPLSSAFVVLFFPFYARVRVSLDSSVCRALMEEPSLFLHLASFSLLTDARMHVKFRFDRRNAEYSSYTYVHARIK